MGDRGKSRDHMGDAGKNRPMGDRGKNIVMGDAGVNADMPAYRFANSPDFRVVDSERIRDVELTETEHAILLCALVEIRGRSEDLYVARTTDIDVLVHKLGGDPDHPTLGLEYPAD